MNLIPEKPTIPKQRLEEYNILLFSEPGMGKTTLGNQFENSIMMLFESGTSGILSYDINLVEKSKETGKPVWELFKEAKHQLLNDEHDFDTVVIDTATKAYDYALDYWRDYKLGGTHPSQTENMIGYSQLNSELKTQFNDLLNSKLGTLIICHAEYKAIKQLDGLKRDKLVPDTGGSFGNWLMGESDIIIFYDKDTEGNRILRVEGSKDFDAKQRIPLSKNIPAGESPQEAYQNFKEEFNQAIKQVNKEMGVTEEMIEAHYQEQKAKEERAEILNKIKDIATSKGLSKEENRNLLQDRYAVQSIADLDNNQAKEYLQFLEEDYLV